VNAHPNNEPNTPEPNQGIPDDEQARRKAGLLFGLGAYLMWGALPLFFTIIQPAGPLEILAHRIVWSLFFCLILLLLARGFPRLWRLLRTPRILGLLTLAAITVAINWFIFVLGVDIGRVVEVSLGYYINPLISVLLGVLFLKEKLRPLQWLAMGIGAVAVVVIAVGNGRFPLLGVGVALSFGLYGLIKKRVGSRAGALEAMTIETIVLFIPSLVYVLYLVSQGQSQFETNGPLHVILMLCLGPVTAIPLILFGSAASRIPLSWVGMLQYVTPTMQFITGVIIMGEHMTPSRWAGFGIIWVTVVLVCVDGVMAARRRRRLR